MNSLAATAAPAQPTPTRTARRFFTLETAAAAWLSVALAGQLIFAGYVLLFYGGSAWAGQWERWAAVTPRGHVPGEPLGNGVFAVHVALTFTIILGGLIQVLPFLRRRAPVLHRWNGRFYLLSALALASGGVVMLLTRGTVGNIGQQLGTALNGAVIAACAWMAWRHARARRFDAHRRWALRLFLAVSGVWFFRVGLMAWLLIWRAPVGFDGKSFTGPFLLVLSYAQFLLPLAVLQLYFWAQARPAGAARQLTAGVLVVATALTALGVTGATLMMWGPRM